MKWVKKLFSRNSDDRTDFEQRIKKQIAFAVPRQVAELNRLGMLTEEAVVANTIAELNLDFPYGTSEEEIRSIIFGKIEPWIIAEMKNVRDRN